MGRRKFVFFFRPAHKKQSGLSRVFSLFSCKSTFCFSQIAGSLLCAISGKAHLREKRGDSPAAAHVEEPSLSFSDSLPIVARHMCASLRPDSCPSRLWFSRTVCAVPHRGRGRLSSAPPPHLFEEGTQVASRVGREGILLCFKISPDLKWLVRKTRMVRLSSGSR